MTRWIPAARALPTHEISEVDRAICCAHRTTTLLDQWAAEDAARGPSAEPVDWPFALWRLSADDEFRLDRSLIYEAEPMPMHQPDDPGEPDGERPSSRNPLLLAVAILAAGLFAWGLVQCFGDLL